MSDLGLAYQEYDFYEELFEKPKRIKRKKEPIQKFQLKLRIVPAKTPNQQLVYDYFEQESHLVLHGLAGTGKTFISLYLALRDIVENYDDKTKVVIVRNGLVESYSSNEGLLQLVVGNVTYERAGASTWNSSVNIAGFATTVQVYAFDRTSRTSSAAWVFKGNF